MSKEAEESSAGLVQKKCQQCNKQFKSSKSGIKKCENCQIIRTNYPHESLDIVQQINLEEDSPLQMVEKMKRKSANSESNVLNEAIEEQHEFSDNANEDENSDSQQSIDQQQKQQQQKLEQAIRNEQAKMTQDRKIVVGSGFTFDMTDFFKFKKKQQLASGQEGTFVDKLAGSPIAWLILLYTVASGAIVPGWIMNIKATKFVRKVWRFLMQALCMIPFIMYQKRNASPQVKQKYKLSYILDRKNICKPYISSLSTSLWFMFILTSFEWTYVSHGIVLGALSNFFLSLGRTWRSQNHQFEIGGQVMVTLGLLLSFQDTITVDATDISDRDLQSQNTFFLHRTWWERFGADIAAIFASFMVSQFSKYTSDMKNYFPPFLSMFLINCFNVFHLSMISFFCNGATFTTESFWGIFSLINDEHFVSFMYMAIVLAFGQIVSVVLVTRMFPDPIIPALALTLDPFIASFIVQLGNIQTLPGNFSMFGYIFIFLGIFVILLGQCLYQKQKSSTDENNVRVKQLLEEIKELKKFNEAREKRISQKQKIKAIRARTAYNITVESPNK